MRTQAIRNWHLRLGATGYFLSFAIRPVSARRATKLVGDRLGIGANTGLAAGHQPRAGDHCPHAERRDGKRQWQDGQPDYSKRL